MRWQDTNTQTCSIARSMSVFGDRWTLLVIRQIFMRIRRFSEIQSSLGIPKHRLSDRLSRLVEDGVVYKDAYDKAGKRFDYKLTEKGLALYPVVVAIAQWGDAWLADDDGNPLEYVHKTCGHSAHPKVCCTVCNESITAHNTYAIPGPGILKKVERDEFSDTDMLLYSKSLGTDTA
ncbi:MAG: DNA-binding HxlR family transcriptional regulator [Cryomorphaceae bacterium]|jgi:DNA-binding HxlR family transcriptional regulator